MSTLRSGLVSALIGVTLVGVQSVEAQSYLVPGSPDKGIWLEVSHPDIKTFEVTAPSSAWFASGRYPVTSGLWGVAEVPFAYGKLSGPSVSDTDGSTVLGNPYLGVEYAATDRVRIEAGARLPVTTADDTSFGNVVGFLADPLRGEAFMKDVFPVSAAVRLAHSLPNGIDLFARGGITSMFWTGDDDMGENVQALDYGVSALYPRGAARFGGGLTGRWDVSADEDGFSENSLHQLGLNADYKFGRTRPGLAIRVPLDSEYRDMVSSSVAIYMQIALP